MRFPRAHRGFTLLEVLVALVIVAFGMGALMATLTSAATSVERLRDRSYAEWVALNRISEVRLGKAAPTTGKTSGESELGGRRWRWTQEITRTELANMIRIDIGVSRADAKADDAAAQLAVATGFTSLPGTLAVNNGLEPDWSLDTLSSQPNPQNPQNPPGGTGSDNSPAGAPPAGADADPPPPPPVPSPESRR